MVQAGNPGKSRDVCDHPALFLTNNHAILKCLLASYSTVNKSKSSKNIIVSAIIPRPCDLLKDPTESRVKKMNSELKLMCKRRHLQFLHTYRIVLHKNKPIRFYFAVNDQGLHLNLEGQRRLRRFLVNTVAHLK